MTRKVQQLERDGLVVRRADPEDVGLRGIVVNPGSSTDPGMSVEGQTGMARSPARWLEAHEDLSRFAERSQRFSSSLVAGDLQDAVAP